MAKEGRGSSDACVDANSNISIVRWLDNGLVQLISNYVGDDDGTKARRWSTKKKEFVEISRPFIVEEYNKHMGGVDLCDMLMALYRIKLRSTKYYMHIVYYYISLSVVNGWLLYRRHCMQNNLTAKDHMSLLNFQSAVSNALMLVGKQINSKRGRPLNTTTPPPKEPKSHAIPTPQNDVRCDGVGHSVPEFSHKQQRVSLLPQGLYFSTMCEVQS